MRYDFERLEVYQQALEFAERIFELTKSFPSQLQFSLGDQLRRAALSICNNVAEGSEKGAASRRQFYGYALGSARECVPMLQLALRLKIFSQEQYRDLDERGFRITSMLYKLIRSVK